MMESNRELVTHLKNRGVLKSQNIIDSFLKVDRCDFVTSSYKNRCYEDYALPIGYDQTISQPTTVAIMLELLEPAPNQKILDIGSGSGWTAALLGAIVGEKGAVFGLERISELVEFGNENIGKYEFNTQILGAGDELGYKKEAPYDRILVSAAAKSLPDKLVEQLAEDGILVVPVRNSIYKITKNLVDSKKEYEKEELHGFAFVPLVE